MIRGEILFQLMFKTFFTVYLGDSDSERMGNSHVNHTIEKKHASKTVQCMVNLCPIYGKINVLSKNDLGIH